jgi:hypothetical protein
MLALERVETAPLVIAVVILPDMMCRVGRRKNERSKKKQEGRREKRSEDATKELFVVRGS